MTDRVTNPKIVKELCERYGFRFKKGLGQNFLIDESVVEDTIVGTGITRNTSVIEIGPGFGSLTQSLLEAAKDVTAIELDSNLIPVLTDLFGSAENFHLINADVLKTDLAALCREKTEGQHLAPPKVKAAARVPVAEAVVRQPAVDVTAVFRP